MHQIPKEITGAGSKTAYSEFQKRIIPFQIRRIASTVAGVYCCDY
jgi:hypothetical protein